MQVGIKFSTAIHALLCVEFFKNEKVTGEFIASSTNNNVAWGGRDKTDKRAKTNHFA